ncbi:MAG: response regulator [Firmicutes bacterium]|nr:response regulator [Bacillota bacterium]
MIRLLLSDDSPGVREVLRTYLRQFPEEFQVVGEAANGEEALRLAKELQPDVILLDIRMPIMDGIAATRELTLESNPGLVITYTGFPLPQLEAMAKKAGAVAHLSKPFDLAELRQLVAGAVQQTA